MPLTAAEKQRRYRDKVNLDKEKRAEYLRKEKARWRKRKESGKVKLADAMTERELRLARRAWKIRRANNRKKEKQLNALMTPPCSPDSNISPPPSHAGVMNERARKRHRRKMVKEIEDLKRRLKDQVREKEKFKKRWQRLNNDGKSNTPRSKTRRLLRYASTSEVRKTLLFHNVLVDQIRRKYAVSKRERQKSLYARLVAGTTVKKYKLQRYMQEQLGFSSKRWPGKFNMGSNEEEGGITYQKYKAASLGTRMMQRIHAFYTRDDNSRITTGKKETITRNKEKRQRRLLTDSMKNIHLKFLSENGNLKLSYSLFCRLRPFWVLPPTATDRQTCLCKLHENCQLLVSKLTSLKILDSKNLDEVVSGLACDVNSKDCMYGDCLACKGKTPDFKTIDKNNSTSWTQWKTVKEMRTIKEVPKAISMTIKQEVKGTVGDLIDQSIDYLQRFKRHYYNIRHQFLFYRQQIQNMGNNECLIHVDFAENYACKYATEIQSMHFGASKKQVSLHTGVYYVGSNGKATSFCSMSDNLEHSPFGIWAHLEPMLDDMQQSYPDIDTIHFFSDGPCTQYKQKHNFFLFTWKLALRGIKFASWNFMEAGHGKGAPDGVGATVKRLADYRVQRGSDCPSATALYNLLNSECKIKLYLVDSEEIEHLKKSFAEITLPTVPGTMKMHQLITKGCGDFTYRDVSCLCKRGEICSCYSPKSFSFAVKYPKGGKASNQSTVINNQESPDRKLYFEAILEEFGTFNTYAGLQSKCIELEDEVDQRYAITGRCVRLSPEMEIDEDAQMNAPDDLPFPHMTPVKVAADGNCLPHTGSVFAFGHANCEAELRARIVIELAVHEKLYLDKDHLRQGADVTDREAKALTRKFCMFSGMYESTGKITEKDISLLYQAEVLELTKNGSYMGIWEIFAMSSVLKAKLFTAYPKRGNPNVRSDMHRLLFPRQLECAETFHLMWTSTRFHEMTGDHFVPNHFVPMLAVEGPEPSTSHTNDLLGMYVAVRYDCAPYPGIVIDVDDEDVQVKCMHQVGLNRFFWPDRDDICWYTKDDIIQIIAPPEKVTDRHLQIKPSIWHDILKKRT